jgi:hypothetical protein
MFDTHPNEASASCIRAIKRSHGPAATAEPDMQRFEVTPPSVHELICRGDLKAAWLAAELGG